MDLIKNLSAKKLKRMKATLELFEFFGISEADIRNLPNLIKENKELKEKVSNLEEKFSIFTKTKVNENDPEKMAKKEINDIAKNCFTLPETEEIK